LYLPELLTNDMAAEVFGVSKDTIRRWREDKGMPHIRVGSKTYFLESSLQNWLKSRETSHQIASNATK